MRLGASDQGVRGRLVERVPGLTAVLDACVLIPVSLCDTLLRAAGADLYRPLWSDDILEEVRRNLAEHSLTGEPDAARRVAIMRRAFPEATVGGYRNLIGGLTNHPDDRHVLAVAVKARARVIVTDHLRHYPDGALDPYGIRALSSDAFLLHLDGLAPERMIDLVHRQAHALRRPPMTVDEVLDHLAQFAPKFVERIRSRR
jgi:predicted nucleic acid-binding protein